MHVLEHQMTSNDAATAALLHAEYDMLILFLCVKAAALKTDR
jgi:hypothetical protein